MVHTVSKTYPVVDLPLPAYWVPKLGTHVVEPKVHHLDDIGQGRILLTRPVTRASVASQPQEVVETLGPGGAATHQQGKKSACDTNRTNSADSADSADSAGRMLVAEQSCQAVHAARVVGVFPSTPL